MEILIPGLILVALMAYASTKIKKRAAEAFKPELIETDEFSLNKPDGFLHVLNSPDHDFEAYSNEFGEDDFSLRRAKIEVNVLQGTDLQTACESLRASSEKYEVVSDSDRGRMVATEETANEIPFTAFYKFIGTGNGIYRLRFAALSRYVDDYRSRIEETLDSFTVTTH